MVPYMWTFLEQVCGIERGVEGGYDEIGFGCL